jgi:hypothetical protein
MATNDTPLPRHTLESHEAEMPDCNDPDCEFHHPEVREYGYPPYNETELKMIKFLQENPWQL